MGTMIFLVPSAIDKGVDLQQASVLSLLYGVGNLVGRVSSGFLITKTGWRPLTICCWLYVICSASFIVHASCRVYIILTINTFVFATSLGFLTTIVFLCIQESLPKALFRGGYFLYAFFFGLGSPIGGLLAGKNRLSPHTCLAFNYICTDWNWLARGGWGENYR